MTKRLFYAYRFTLHAFIMFSFAVSIGIYSYLIFVLGLLGVLTKPAIIITTLVFILGILLYSRKEIRKYALILKSKQNSIRLPYYVLRLREQIGKNKTVSFSLLLLILLAMVNLIGALGPELAFDALWYHLTLPKLYLLHHMIEHISGGLLYYSEMPRLTEMLYTAALAFDSEILAKIIHFLFGIFSLAALYKLSREFFNKKIALLVLLIFYGNLVMDWESITAYIDLARTFFEIMALWGMIRWIKTQNKKWLIASAIVLGLAISTKTLAIGSLGIFIIVLILYGIHKKEKVKKTVKTIFLYTGIALLIPSPWFINASINTGNPFFPLFANYEIHQTLWQVINPFRFITSLWNLFTHSSDPLSPLYIIFAPLLLFQLFKKMLLGGITIQSKKGGNYPFLSSWLVQDLRDAYKHIVSLRYVNQEHFSYLKQKHNTIRFKRFRTSRNDKLFALVIIYSTLSIIVWYITPQTGGGRFILPYLPALSIVIASVLEYNYSRVFKQVLIGLIFLIAISSIVYRAEANKKYVPVIFGQQTKAQFLTKNLNFSFGDFYDIDGYFAKHIKPNTTVLLYGFHNLYYVDFPFIDSSWIKPGDRFDYIATQNTELPGRFRFWELLYINKKTNVKLYMYHHHQWIY